MTIKTKFFALALLAAPLALTAAPVSAAPNGGGMMMGGRHDAMHDHAHRPPLRDEHRPPMPHGHYRWRTGAWGWHDGAWAWTPGIWIRF